MKIKKKKHHKGRNYHHLIPKSKGGKPTSQNLLLIDVEKHIEWHKLFGTKTLRQVIMLLIRLRRLKKRQT